MKGLGRLVLLAAGALAAGGCTTTHTVSRADPSALARLTDDVEGETVEVVHIADRERGTRVRVYPDSTRWLSGDTSRAVATKTVRALVVNPRRENVALWSAVGAAFGGLAGGTLCGDLEGNPACYMLMIPVGVAGGALVFSLYAAIGTQTIEYRLDE